MARDREDPKIRRSQILSAAIKVAKKRGYQHITRKEIAESIGISTNLITHYFSVQRLKIEIMKEAIKNEIYEIIAQGLSVNDPQVTKLSKSFKKRVLTYLTD